MSSISHLAELRGGPNLSLFSS